MAAARADVSNGYTDGAASERRSSAMCSSRGDAWYRTGDLMRRDDCGFLLFVDRIGDTSAGGVKTSPPEKSPRLYATISRDSRRSCLWGHPPRRRGTRRNGRDLVSSSPLDLGATPHTSPCAPASSTMRSRCSCACVGRSQPLRPSNIARADLSRLATTRKRTSDPIYVNDAKQGRLRTARSRRSMKASKWNADAFERIIALRCRRPKIQGSL